MGLAVSGTAVTGDARVHSETGDVGRFDWVANLARFIEAVEASAAPDPPGGTGVRAVCQAGRSR